MSKLKYPSWNHPCNPKPSLQITPAETTKLTPKRKRSNPSRSRSRSRSRPPPPQPWSWNWSWDWEWDWESTPSLLVSSSSPLLIPSPSLSPLSTHPRAESIPSFKPKAWLSVAKAILHNFKAETGTGADPINRAMLKSLEDAVWIVNEEITGIETVGEEMRRWGGVSVREAVAIVEEAESNIWACLDRMRAEIGEIYGDGRDNKAREAIQCLLMGNIGEVDALLEYMNT